MKNICRRILILLAVAAVFVVAAPRSSYAATKNGLTEPTRLTASNYDKRTVIRWFKVTGANGYILYQKKEDRWKKIATTKDIGFSVENLENNVEYTFRVCAYRLVGSKMLPGPVSKPIVAKPFKQSAKKFKKTGVAEIHSFYYKAKMKADYRTKSRDGGKKVTFKNGQNVIVKSSSGSNYILLYKKKEYKVPKSIVGIYDFESVYKQPYSTKQAEAFVNLKGYASESKYLIWISTYTQYIYLFEGSQYNWKLKWKTICATGMYGYDEWDRHTPTPIGISYVYSKLSEGYFAADQVAYYLSYVAGGAIHSWLYYPGGGYYRNVGKMGTPSSHGCVRIDIKYAKWIYDNVPIGTTNVTY